jgi:hypothetical protein
MFQSVYGRNLKMLFLSGVIIREISRGGTAVGKSYKKKHPILECFSSDSKSYLPFDEAL